MRNGTGHLPLRRQRSILLRFDVPELKWNISRTIPAGAGCFYRRLPPLFSPAGRFTGFSERPVPKHFLQLPARGVPSERRYRPALRCRASRTIRIFPDDTTITSTKPFLDIDSVASGGELGLLGL